MKTNKDLGLKVKAHLLAMGVETPMLDIKISNEEKIQVICEQFEAIMDVLGLNLGDDSLIGTPLRVAKMYVNEVFAGLDYDNFPKCTTVENQMGYDEMVHVKDITAISNCEHHFVIIDQKVHVAYIPKQKVLGLSKINRLAKFFAQRPQIQERYTEQLFHALQFILETEDVAVRVTGKHYCVAARGVEDSSSTTVTVKLGGSFKNNSDTRSEFMAAARSS